MAFIYPLFWMKGEDEHTIRETIGKMDESGIKGFIIESRPHPDFLGEKWWQDIDIVIDEAKKRAMKIWFFDDAHFPTGYANGAIKETFKEQGKRYITYKKIDGIGPLKAAQFYINLRMSHSMMSENPKKVYDFLEDKIIGIVACKRKQGSSDLSGEVVDMQPYYDEATGILEWDIPKGAWRIYIIYSTVEGGGYEHYINPVSKESVDVLINAVYEPHYNKYKEEFGHTIAGFFSDEPGFGNVSGYSFVESIGRSQMVLPWSDELPGILAERLGANYYLELPGLWAKLGENHSCIRVAYMDSITRLYAENFTGRIGAWCKLRGVEYIGHVIEDNNVHARLGVGAGHFYRSMYGQSMAGIDVVLHQILPGYDVYNPIFSTEDWDGEFFHYMLAKMGSSLGHLNPNMKGRTICEVFGAFGWREGVRLMKWLTDHMLVRGVNHFIPHAFSMAAYPDPDCPPHFYAKGENLQFPYFGQLMTYMNHMCYLLNDGEHIAPVAILYHAEAEWAGDYMLSQVPAKNLMQAQIDFDIVPADCLSDTGLFSTMVLEEEQLCINGEKFKAFVVPYSQILPESVIEALEKMMNQIPVIFLKALPDNATDLLQACTVLEVEVLAEYLKSIDVRDISVKKSEPYLRYYHYKKKTNASDSHIYMFFNEDPYNKIEVEVNLEQKGDCYIYDVFEGTYQKAYIEQMSLLPYESQVIIITDDLSNIKAITGRQLRKSDAKYGDYVKYELDKCVSGSLNWKVKVGENTFEALAKLGNMTSLAMHPDFSGILTYEATFDLKTLDYEELNLGQVYETAKVWLNGALIGSRIAPPFSYNISGLLKELNNHLVIEVSNTLVHEQKDSLSLPHMIEPSGLFGPMTLSMVII